MPRLVFPDSGDRLVYQGGTQGTPFLSAAGTQIFIYTDAAATALADIQDINGVPIAGSFLTVDNNSILPLFLGPNTGVDTLYAKSAGSSIISTIYARETDRINALASAWTAYTPNTTGITLGNGALTAAYSLVGKTLRFRVRLLWGSTTSTTGDWSFTLPLSLLAQGDQAAGSAIQFHASTGNRYRGLTTISDAANNFFAQFSDGTFVAPAGLVVAAATGDIFTFSGLIEVR